MPSLHSVTFLPACAAGANIPRPSLFADVFLASSVEMAVLNAWPFGQKRIIFLYGGHRFPTN
ncbi:MAG: hypothetical protein ABR99_08850 [Rhodobacter sp. BACL10 MAG-121220-bin24]|nr:MAG: hypothetical protein ABR99_08850 [Rhodobacter sp. BACL10 MAG-121220-bin24]KRP25547.1 MAG: hypothetical protein ABR97_09500 [Rhodobacter sp. BACL10 MAG-120419-bin15]HCK06999.1 hypothetical protein [Rhodobacter sp.]